MSNANALTTQQLLDQADPLFLAAFETLLASKIAPAIKQDGNATSSQLLQVFDQKLTRARMRDAREGKSRRYDPASESRFVRAHQ